MAKKENISTIPNSYERRDLNMITTAYFDLFSPFKPRPSKTQLIYWIKQFRKKEKKEREKK